MHSKTEIKITETKGSVILITGFKGLRDLINEIPEGTVYSVDISEVISIGQEDG